VSALLAPAHRGSIRRELRWAATPKAARRTSKPNPNDPSRVVGFDVEVAQLLAAGLGREARFIQVRLHQHRLPRPARGDFDVGLSGIEDSRARRAGSPSRFRTYESANAHRARIGRGQVPVR